MQRRLSFVVPPLEQCDLAGLVVPEGPEHAPDRLAAALDHRVMYVLVLVGVLERRVLRDDGLEEFKQLPLEVRLASDRATFLRVATDDAQRCTVI